MNGDCNRRFGSIGLSIDAFSTRVAISSSPTFETLGAEPERSAKIARRIADHLKLDLNQTVCIEDAIPAHAGFGSGT